jgi:hypothetical protein
MSILLRHRLSSTLMLPVILMLAVSVLLSSCPAYDPVREYFQTHGMTYPADVSGIGLLGIDYIGIERDELSSPEAREFVEEGIMFAKEYFVKEDMESIMPGISAIIVSKPVLFRDGSGKAGLMVTVTGFGAGEPDSKMKLEIEWVGKDRSFWKVQNFAYFNRNEFYKWQFGGWVYPNAS